jgi:hypothetical protein
MSSVASRSPVITAVTCVLAVIRTAFGLDAMLRPRYGLTYFNFQPPTDEAARDMIYSLTIVLGVRDVFMGTAMYATAILGSPRALGWILISATNVAISDGVACYFYGEGYWIHWICAPILAVFGLVRLGVFDQRMEVKVDGRRIESNRISRGA